MKSSQSKFSGKLLSSSRSVLELLASRHVQIRATILDTKGERVQDGDRKPHTLTTNQTYVLLPGFGGKKEFTPIVVFGLVKGETYPKGVIIPHSPDEYIDVSRMRVEKDVVHFYDDPRRLLTVPHSHVLSFLRDKLVIITLLHRKERADTVRRIAAQT